MGEYDVQQVCLNGHQINDQCSFSPEHNRKFCAKCGAITIKECPHCGKPIPGYYSATYIVTTAPTEVPEYCEGCGKPFPWTEKRNSSNAEYGATSNASLVDEIKIADSSGDSFDLANTKRLFAEISHLPPLRQPENIPVWLDNFEKFRTACINDDGQLTPGFESLVPLAERAPLLSAIRDLSEGTKMFKSSPAGNREYAQYLSEIGRILDSCDDRPDSEDNGPTIGEKRNPKKVFVVHGRNMAARDAMFTFLRALGLSPIEWSQAVKLTGKATPSTWETVNAGLNAAQAVVVVFTGDEQTRLRSHLSERDEEERYVFQSRPNVIFEAGLAFGKSPKRVILVEIGDSHVFSDIHGMNTIRLPGDAEKLNELKGRLKICNCEIDDSGSDWLKMDRFEEAIRKASPDTEDR